MKNLAELRSQLLEWLNEFKVWYGSSEQSWEDYLYTDTKYWKYLYPYDQSRTELNDEGVFHCLIWTENNEYHISCSFHRNETATRPTMLASVHARKYRTGENWRRGNDLPDGPFSKATFDAIISAIARYEIVAKAKKIVPMTDTPEIPTTGFPSVVKEQ